MFKPQIPERDNYYSPLPPLPDPTVQMPTSNPLNPGNPWSSPELFSARDFYTKFINDHQIPVGFGNINDPMEIYKSMRTQGQSHDQALNGALPYLGWDKYTAPSAAGAGTASGSSGGGGQMGGGFVNSGQGLFDPALYAPWKGTPPSYTPPTLAQVPSFDTYYDVNANPVPTYQAPVYRGPGMTKK